MEPIRRASGGLTVIAAWVLLCASPGAVAAAGDDVFRVERVAVDQEAETASLARDAAILEGQRDAFRRLLERITLRADRDRLPVLDDRRIINLVSGIEVAEEKASSTRYLASLTISFKKEEIRGLLRSAGIPFTETRAKPVLVLPVYEAAAQVLWEEPNPWRAAWIARERGDSLLPLLVPAGDLTDIATISASQAVAGERDRLAALAGRYGIEAVVVARGLLVANTGAGSPALEVSLNWFGPAGERMVVQGFVTEPGETVEQMLARAAGRMDIELEELWKRETLLRFDQERRLSARVPLSGLGDWLAVRDRLEATAVVRGYEVASLTKQDAQVVLTFLGDVEQLAVSLSQRDLDLIDEAGFWILRRRDAAPATNQ